MVIFRSIFSIFLSFNTQLTHLNASNLLNFDSLNRFLPIASQSWYYVFLYVVRNFVTVS